MKKLINLTFATLLSITLISCGYLENNETAKTAAIGGAGGAAVGASIGYAVGAAISNGDVWASAQLGAAIGAPVGALAAYAYRVDKENGQVEHRNDIILSNYDEILFTQRELDQMEQEVMSKVSELEPTTEQSSHYTGPTIGY